MDQAVLRDRMGLVILNLNQVCQRMVHLSSGMSSSRVVGAEKVEGWIN